MRKIFTLLSFAFSSFALAQVAPEIQWSKTYGGSTEESAEQIIQTADGGYAFIGYSRSNDGDVTENKGQADVWFVKTDASGTIEWQKTYGGSNSDTGSALKQTPDGGYIIGANTQSSDGDVSEYNGALGYGEDFWLVKISSTGVIEWEKNYGGDYPDILTDLQLTSDGGYIAIGNTSSKSGDVTGGYGTEGNFFQEGWVVKIDVNGEIEWQRPYGGYEGFVEFKNIQQTTDGGFIIGGNAGYGFDGDFPATHAGSSDFWALKIDATGGIEWSKVFGGSTEDYSGKITQTSDGGYIFVGGVYSNDGDVAGGLGNGNTDMWVLKLDSLGAIEWKKIISGAGSEGGIIAHETPDHHFVIGGGTSSSDGDFADFPNNGMVNMLLMKLNGTDGSSIWMKTMGGSLNDVFYDFLITSDGGFLTVGLTASNNGDVSGNHGSSDAWVVKLSPDCVVPELNADTTHTICAGEALTLTAGLEAETVNWYAAADAETPVFTGSSFEVPELSQTTSYWVEASNAVCKTARTEVVVTVNPLPVLEAETAYAICYGNEASLSASSPSNVIFWYANETDTQYLYHGNLFVTEELTASTTFWVEAYNLLTGCRSERTEVVITVGEDLSAPVAASRQLFVTGLTLADLAVDHTGTLTWYANEALTTELPETTLTVDGATYYVTQSVGECASAATSIFVTTSLSTIESAADRFAYYPNPVNDVLNFKGNESVHTLQVYDLNGRLVLNQHSNSIVSINLSALPKATYIVKAITDKGVNAFKVVKN